MDNSGQIKICLVTTLKNNSQNLKYFIDNVKNIGIDYICAFDAGSIDNTIEIIEGFMKEQNIQGKIYKNVKESIDNIRYL